MRNSEEPIDTSYSSREMKLEALRKEIQKGLDDLEAGRVLDGPEAMEEIRVRLLRMRSSKELDKNPLSIQEDY